MPSDSSSPIDPLIAVRRRGGAALAVLTTALVAAAIYASVLPHRPMPGLDPASPAPEPEQTLDRDDLLALTGFDARLWVEPTPPPAPEPVAAEPEPVRVDLQLIAIVNEPGPRGTVRRAVLYDPVTDRLHMVAAGESVGRVRVDDVQERAVTLETGRRTTRLRLAEATP